MITNRFLALAAGAALLGLGPGGIAVPAQAQSALSPAQPVAAPVDQQAERRAEERIWTDASGQPTEAALILVDFLRRADAHALPAAKYRGDELAARIGNGGGPDLEADLTRAYLAYAGDLHAGVLDPSEIDEDLHIEVQRPDMNALLAGAAGAANMAVYLESLAPQNPAYRRLVERYRSFRSMAASDIWGPRLGGGGTLRPGDRGPRVAAARARLTAMGDLDPNTLDAQAADGTRLAATEVTTDAATGHAPGHFGPALEEAVTRFQTRHGLNPDGLIGPATRAQLDISPRERARQIAVNLERMRWLNGQIPDDRYILVNTAGFEMWVMEDGEAVFSSRVINGEAGEWETPEFSGTMDHLVINPTWYVPMSIAKYEMLPKLKQDPDYLAKRGMRLIGAEEEEIDWQSVTPETFPGRVTQLPGDANAMGNVKFMFPNRHSIYLHDTPARQLFKRDVRDFSHGCVRVEKAHELAQYLLGSEARFDRALASGTEQRINLDDPLPVILTYRTAWISDNGVEQFRGDIYGRDRVVARALGSAGVRIPN